MVERRSLCDFRRIDALHAARRHESVDDRARGDHRGEHDQQREPEGHPDLFLAMDVHVTTSPGGGRTLRTTRRR